MRMLRRAFLRIFAAVFTRAVFGQQAFHGLFWATFGVRTTHTTGYNPNITKTGATLLWKWPDGTFTSSNAPTKNLPAGTKAVLAISQDGFKGVTTFGHASLDGVGIFPPLGAFTNLTTIAINVNAFSGNMPSFAPCTALVTFTANANSFSGTLPSFAPCTALVNFTVNQCSFSGVLPSFAACVNLVSFNAGLNAFTGTVAGSFATQKSATLLAFGVNALSSAAVNQILADCVASLGGGRVACTVTLQGGTNGAPTGQGIIDKAALITAGWTVVTN